MSASPGLYDVLRHGDNLAGRYGLEPPIHVYARTAHRDHVFLTVGTPADHLSRTIELPIRLAGRRDVEDWIDGQLRELIAEYRQPLRALYWRGVVDLQAAVDAGATVWPPLEDSGLAA